MPLNTGAGEDSWKPLGQHDQISQSYGKSTLNTHWKDWGWSWSSSILVIWFEQPTQWKSPWCWERLRAEGEKGIRGWDGWTASLTQWTWTWANSRRRWGTGKPGVLQSMGSQSWTRLGDWTTTTKYIGMMEMCGVEVCFIYQNGVYILSWKAWKTFKEENSYN